MYGYRRRLGELREAIRVALVGLGSAGTGLALQVSRTPGLRLVAVADRREGAAGQALELVGARGTPVASARAVRDTIEAGGLAVCDEGLCIAESGAVDVLIEATNDVLAGGRNAEAALASGAHVVMMNYEAAHAWGPWLTERARAAGRVYTVCDGDQPAVLARLADEVSFMDFRVVMAGNVKGFLDRTATPSSIEAEAAKRGLDPRMCASYTDGTKLNIEMAVLANGLDLRPAVDGMLGPRVAHVREALSAFDFEALWDGHQGLVDYVLGAEPRGGVFVVGYTEHPFQRRALAWLPPAMGEGPFYVFYRPYHLVHFEAMASVAQAALDGRPVLAPQPGSATEVVAYAKRDLDCGEPLQGPGGATCFGLIEAPSPSRPAGLPICLADGVVMRTAIARGQRIDLASLIEPPRQLPSNHWLAAQAR